MSAGAALPSVGATTAKAASTGAGSGGGGGHAVVTPLVEPGLDAAAEESPGAGAVAVVAGLNADAEETPGAGAVAAAAVGVRYSGRMLAP